MGVGVLTPEHPAEVARALVRASREGLRVAVRHDAWSPDDAPADVVLETRGLTDLRDIAPADQLVTVGAGVRLADLQARAPWFAADPPGPDRTIGGMLATGSAGPLRTGYGGLRDQVLGLTAVTGDGRSVTVGGRVMKNVAGYDLAKLFIGGADAYGVIVEAHLRLRAVPRHDATFTRRGRRDDLLGHALDLLHAGERPAALELHGDDTGYTLALRRHHAAASPSGMDSAETRHWDRLAGRAPGPVVLRVGALPTALGSALTILEAELPAAGWTSATVHPGAVRWSGFADADAVARARASLARHEMPLTLERAPWDLRVSVGVHGAFREGISPLTHALRAAFDPAGVLRV